MSTIVVGMDGSEPAREALRFALEEAALRGASIRAVHAWQFIPPDVGYVTGAYGPIDLDLGAIRRSAEAKLEAEVTGVAGEQPGIEIERRLVEGVAAQVLVEESRDADLLVVGSRGHGGFTGLLLGSVSQQVSQHAFCPVVIVHPRRKE